MRRLGVAAAAIASVLGFPGAAAAAARLPLILPLKADDAGLRAFATAVSTPGSPLYGRYEPVALLARRFGAGARTQAAVAGYLRASGATDVRVSPTGMYVQATMSVALAERTFGTSLISARAAGGARYLAPRHAARLPAPLAGRALGVVGLDTRPLVRTGQAPVQASSGYRPASGTPGGCAAGVHTGGFTPNQYLTAYGYTPLRRTGLAGQGERVALIEIDGFKRSDLTTFARCFDLRIPPISVYGVGIPRRLAPGPEATLDLEMLDAAAPAARSYEVFETRSNAVAMDAAFAAPLLVRGPKPQVISASLGLCEPAMFAAFGAAGIMSVERDLELAAAAGITTLTAAGDSGSADCTDRQGTTLDALAIDYPSASWWVTSVGGTNVHLDAGNHIDAREVWNDTSAQVAAGGGGTSRLFLRPSFQDGVVAPNRRAVPDVSLLADVAPGYVIYCTPARTRCHGWRTVGGTSAAAPLLAGGMALIDQDLERHGRPPLGLADPLLYYLGRSSARTAVFDDVMLGSNDVGQYVSDGNGQPLGCCSAGPGFDWASGWGGVDLAALDQAALRLVPGQGPASVSVPAGQDPVAGGGISVRLACSRRCTAYAYAVIAISGGPLLRVRSPAYHFGHRGARTVELRFSRSQEGWLRLALAHRDSTLAEVFGALVGPKGGLKSVTFGRISVII